MTQAVLICVLVLCVVLKIVSIARRLEEERKQRSEEHRIEMLIQRNEQVELFRIKFIYMFGITTDDKLNSCMPPYADMLYSDKPLEAKHWVDVDKLVNLN